METETKDKCFTDVTNVGTDGFKFKHGLLGMDYCNEISCWHKELNAHHIYPVQHVTQCFTLH